MSLEKIEPENLQYEWVASGEHLVTFCKKLSTKKILALDTEFVRVKTFYPQLGIIQVFDGDNLAIIDPLAIDDLSPFIDILKKDEIVKLFFAPDEDITLLYHHFKLKMNNILDVQLLAKKLDYKKVSFDAVLLERLGISIDKSDELRRQNWQKRPLAKKALDYAAFDVFYLLPLFKALKSDFSQSKMVIKQAILEQNQLNEKIYQRFNDNYVAFKSSKYRNKKQCKLLNWRYGVAKKEDKAQNFIVNKQTIVKLSTAIIHRKTDLYRYLEHWQVKNYGDDIFEIVANSKN